MIASESVVQQLVQANSFTVFLSYLKHVMASCVTCSTAACSIVQVDRQKVASKDCFHLRNHRSKEKIWEAEDASSVCQNTRFVRTILPLSS